MLHVGKALSDLPAGKSVVWSARGVIVIAFGTLVTGGRGCGRVRYVRSCVRVASAGSALCPRGVRLE